jgi:hypothetical protein
MIKGLTPSLPERGKIKIGMKGAAITSKRGNEFQPPQKLDHFIVTTLQRGHDGNFIPDETLMSRLGPKPTEIPVRLLYDDPALNFPTRYACFIGRALWCSGDGEVATRLTETAQEMTTPTPRIEPREVSCPCPRSDPSYDRRDKCKMNGSLSVLIEGAGGVGGVWKFRTTSYNSIVGIMSSLGFLWRVTGGVLANIPLKLRVQPKQATAPDGSQVTVYIVSLEFDGDISGLQTIAHGIALDRAKTRVSIEHIEEEAKRLLALAPPANVPLPGDDADDIVEEFYPEQVMPEPEPPRGRDIRQPEPPRGAAIEHRPEPPRTYLVVDCDGEEHEFETAETAARVLKEVFEDAERRGPSHVEAARENNRDLIAEIGEPQTSPPTGTPSTPVAQDAASIEARQPGGEPINDLLGGEARPAESLRVRRSGDTTDDWYGWERAIEALIESGDPKADILRDNAADLRKYDQMEPMRAAKLARALGAK